MGLNVGAHEGSKVGLMDGTGLVVGLIVEGKAVGFVEGRWVGLDGEHDGVVDGRIVGSLVG